MGILKRRNGITVIVLVITIIIMLILAGIALNMLITDKGLIEKSNKSNFDLALSEMYERGDSELSYLRISDRIKKSRRNQFWKTIWK